MYDVRTCQHKIEVLNRVAHECDWGDLHQLVRHHEVVERERCAGHFDRKSDGITIVRAGDHIVHLGIKPHPPVLVAPAGADETRRVPPVYDDSGRQVFHRRCVVPVNHDDHLLLVAAAPDPEIVLAVGQIEMYCTRRIRIDVGRVVAVKPLDGLDLHLAVARKPPYGHAVGVRVRVRSNPGDGIRQFRFIRAAENHHPRRNIAG